VDLELANRSVMITGGSRGIGGAIARALASEGCSPIHLVAREAERLAASASELAARYGVRVMTHAVDLAERGATDRLATIGGDLDILVNSAGAIPRGTLFEVDEAAWRTSWDVKVYSCIALCRLIYASMRSRGHGVIINVVGNAGERPDASYIAAGSANAALIYFTEALGGESLRDGVRVLGVNPGAVLTDRFIAGARRRAERRLGDPERWRETLGELPRGRPAYPEEVASVVAFLASERAAYLSGVLVRVDGGHSRRPPPL
jgi:hypothetical protein